MFTTLKVHKVKSEWFRSLDQITKTHANIVKELVGIRDGFGECILTEEEIVAMINNICTS